MASDVKLTPGDLFDWVYKSANDPVLPNEELWSSLMKQYVRIGGPEPMLCIGITDEVIVWLSAKGLFHAHVDDTQALGAADIDLEVVPRARG